MSEEDLQQLCWGSMASSTTGHLAPGTWHLWLLRPTMLCTMLLWAPVVCIPLTMLVADC